jgi:3-methyladenine DNA glycosylase AlkD
LDIYVKYIDNWSSCDILSINIKDMDKLFDLALSYTKSNKPFVRRVGFRLFFKFLDNEEYLIKIFDVVDSFYYEEHYYVNMIIAWLLCEAFIKNRKFTLRYLEKRNLNDFVINKTISKCRDSYRVSLEDKKMLLNFKRKICQK